MSDWRDDARGMLADSWEGWYLRAEAAEAAIKRVRELHCLYDEHWPHCNRCHEVYPCDTIQALDGES